MTHCTGGARDHQAVVAIRRPGAHVHVIGGSSRWRDRVGAEGGSHAGRRAAVGQCHRAVKTAQRAEGQRGGAAAGLADIQSGRSRADGEIRGTGGKFEGADARLPVGAGGVVVFGGVPKGAAVHWIDGHGGIIAPTGIGGLRTGAGDQGGLALAQGAQGVGAEAPGIADRREHGRTGDTVPHGHITELVHRQAAHPSMHGIGLVGTLLVEGGRGVGGADFVPANAGHPAAGYAVGGPQALGAANIAVLHLHHQAVAEGVQVRTALGRHRTSGGVGGHGDIRRPGKGGVGRGDPIDMEFPHAQIGGGAAREKEVRRTGRRQGAAQIGREDAVVGVAQVEDHITNGGAAGQIVAVERPQAHTHEIGAAAGGGQAVEHIGRHVDAIRPHAQLGIVVEPGVRGVIGAEAVHPPAAGDGIGGLGDGDTFVIRAILDIGPGEVGDDPAIGDGIVQHDRVAVVVGVTRGAGEVEEIVEGEGSKLRAGLVVNTDRSIDGLDIMVGADIAVGVRRPAGAPGVEVEAGEILHGGWHDGGRIDRLGHRVDKIFLPLLGAVPFPHAVRNRHFHTHFDLIRPNLRQITQIAIEGGRVDQLADRRASDVISERAGDKMSFKLVPLPALHAHHLAAGCDQPARLRRREITIDEACHQ